LTGVLWPFVWWKKGKLKHRVDVQCWVEEVLRLHHQIIISRLCIVAWDWLAYTGGLASSVVVHEWVRTDNGVHIGDPIIRLTEFKC